MLIRALISTPSTKSSKFMALGLVSHRLWGVQYARDARNTQLRWLNCARQWHWGCRGAGGSFSLTCKVIQVTCCVLHPRINFIGRTLTLPVCLYSVECNIVPFGCLFWPSTCKSRWSRGTLKLSEIRILVIILDKILLMTLVALLLLKTWASWASGRDIEVGAVVEAPVGFTALQKSQVIQETSRDKTWQELVTKWL